MDLKVKSHILSKHFISKISLNHQHNILAMLVDSADTVAFFHMTNDGPVSIFEGMSKPSGKKSCLGWSPDGQYLALGSNNLELWKFDGRKMIPVKNYSEDFLDVKIVAWSPDSACIAYGGLSIKNTIKVKNIQSNSTKDISIPLSVSSISFDPFGKYLLLLLRNNFMYVYNSTNLTKVKEVQLGRNEDMSESVNTVKEIRGIGWSPDFGIMVCPSLDDSKVSVALGFSRNNGFKLRQAFIGHVSSISCAKFNPNLYEYQGQIVSILALGDSHGVISLWRIGKQQQLSFEPVFLSNTNGDYHEIIEEMQWQKQGSVLIVNVMKRYINVLEFDKSKFGRQLNAKQKSQIIEQSYGVRSAAQISQKKLEVFSMAQVSKQSSENQGQIVENKQESALSQQANATQQNQVTFGNQKPSEYVKVNDQVTIKGKNNKKKIQPAMLVRKDEISKVVPTQSTSSQQILPNNSNVYSTIGNYQPLKLSPLRQEMSFIKIDRIRFMEIRKIQGYSIVKLFCQEQAQKILVNQRVFTGSIDWISIRSSKMYFLNAGNLYIFGFELNLLDIPYSIGQVHRIVASDQGDIYYITQKGLIKGFNPIEKICYTPIPVTLQSLIESTKWKPVENGVEEKEQYERVVENFWVEKNHNVYLSLWGNKNKYFYCRETQSWISLELNQGLMQKGDSLKIGQSQNNLCKLFFSNLTSKFVPETTQLIQTPLQQFQTNMIYYTSHLPNRQLYIDNLIGLLRQLKMRNNSDRLRREIRKYFVDKQSKCYEEDDKVRERVRSIGGSVIKQFILFGQL